MTFSFENLDRTRQMTYREDNLIVRNAFIFKTNIFTTTLLAFLPAFDAEKRWQAARKFLSPTFSISMIF